MEPIAPESMIGAMAGIALPALAASATAARHDDAAADALTVSLANDDRIEVPINAFPVKAARSPGAGPTAALVRISAQRYNEAADYERLAAVLVRRGLS